MTCKWFSVCPVRIHTEAGKIPKHWVQNYCQNNGKNCVRYDLEERGIYHPDTMLPDGTSVEEQD